VLVVTRRVNERLDIKTTTGETITVSVTGIRGAQVRIGIEAPAEFKIERPKRSASPDGRPPA